MSTFTYKIKLNAIEKGMLAGLALMLIIASTVPGMVAAARNTVDTAPIEEVSEENTIENSEEVAIVEPEKVAVAPVQKAVAKPAVKPSLVSDNPTGTLVYVDPIAEGISFREMRVSSTAYNSEVAQTDSTPCITANGFDVCKNGVENVVAANFLPFGTKIQIPEMFGDRVFTVQDRMNKRYYYKVDVWMVSKQDALQYGNRTVTIRIFD